MSALRSGPLSGFDPPGPRLVQPPARLPVLALRQVSKRFNSVRALEQVDFDIHPREVVAVVGDNAAGKSVLAKTIAGVYQPDSGDIYWEGHPTSIPNPSAAYELGIASVFQELALCDNLSIVQNLFLGREIAKSTVLADDRMDEIARRILADLGAKLPPVRTLVAHLSPASARRPPSRAPCWARRRWS